MKNTLPALFILILLAGACESKETSRPTRVTKTHQIGATEIRTSLHTFPGSNLLYFNMHDDENTAVQAALRVLARTGGKLLQLEHSGERLIRFGLKGEEFVVDPNRIFTQEGIRATLERHGRFDADASEAVHNFAREILEEYDLMNRQVIVTLHNNQEDGYSTLSYRGEGSYANDARAVYLSESLDPDDFFFVTTEPLFELFKKSGWNVVLQDNSHSTNDGSLSVLAGRKGIPYINIEAQHGHLSSQEAMILEVHQHFNEADD